MEFKKKIKSRLKSVMDNKSVGISLVCRPSRSRRYKTMFNCMEIMRVHRL